MNNNEQNNKKKRTGILLSILAIISLVLITAGVTYAFFSYAKEGLTENVLTTGKITFYYDETYGTGKGIAIQDAIPMSDTAGKALANQDQTFTFQITSTNTGTTPIKYKITARRTDQSSLSDSAVKLYLTGTGNYDSTMNKTEVDSVIQTFAQLTTYTNDKNYNERIIYEETIPENNKTNYSADFTLRMWLAQNDEEGTSTEADYSSYEFVKTSISTEEADTDKGAYDADKLIAAKEFITSVEYYKLDTDGRKEYERIAYVDQINRKVIPASKAKEKGYVNIDDTTKVITETEQKLDDENFVFGEQFYQLNGQEFSVIVNVYANAEVVE